MASWDKKLLKAARDGNIKEVESCVKNRANLECSDEFLGMTPLMLAAGGGRLEVVTYLVSHGSQLEATDTTFGRTALHYAAEYGRIDVTKWLIDQGCSPWVKSKQGRTPYDMATMATSFIPDSEERKRKKKEVMDFLETVMSKTPPEVTPDAQSPDPAAPVVGDEVPTEIKLMTDKRSVELYLKLLQSGSEKKRDIRLVIVGKKGAGKTSLIKKLFGEDITDVTSTNGIEIRTIKCKAMSDDGVWNKLDGTNEEAEIHARLLKQYKGTIEESVEDETHEAVTDNTPKTILYKRSEVSETVSGLKLKYCLFALYRPTL